MGSRRRANRSATGLGCALPIRKTDTSALRRISQTVKLSCMENSRQLSLFDDPSFFESVDVEFKSGRGGLPGSLWETYSAFANTNGGTIYIGIAEKDESLDVHGIK